MNIKDFKAGDIITRNKPVTYKHNDSMDSSYCGDRLVFEGVDEVAKIIFFTGEILGGMKLSYARDAWDEGWYFFPETLWQKIKSKFRKK